MCGDPHGDLDFVERAAALAAEHDAEIICLGDWGFIWPGDDKLDALSVVLARAGEYQAKSPVTMRFIDGNHDDHVRLCEMTERSPKATWLTDNIIYQPRGSVHEDANGTRFLFCGGAPSIDYQFRREGYSWWEKEEVISQEEYELTMSADGPIHVLVTHDTHSYPPGYGPKGTPEFHVKAVRSMGMIAGLVAKHRPPVHFHGHWHTRHTDYRMPGTVTYGIAANVNRFEDAVMLWSRS